MGRQHVDLIRSSPEAELVAVADPAVAPGSLDVPAYGAVGELLDAQQVDAVVIANPNALHVDTAIECLARGTAVLLEKPVATSYADALRLVTAVDELGGRLLVGHHRRHHPAIAAARAALAGGELGQVVAVSGMWSARKDDAYFADVPWHRERGAGVLLINLVHDLDLLRHLFGEVAEIQAMTSHHARGLEVEDTVSVNLQFESGAVGSFLASDAGVSPWGWDQSRAGLGRLPVRPGRCGVPDRRHAAALSPCRTWRSTPTTRRSSPTGIRRCRARISPGERAARSAPSWITSSTWCAARPSPLVPAERRGSHHRPGGGSGARRRAARDGRR